MHLDSRLNQLIHRRVSTNGRIGTRQGYMELSHKHNKYPYRRYEQHNQGFMTGLKSYSIQTMFVTAANVLKCLGNADFNRNTYKKLHFAEIEKFASEAQHSVRQAIHKICKIKHKLKTTHARQAGTTQP